MERTRRKIIIDCCLKKFSKPDQIIIRIKISLERIIRNRNGIFEGEFIHEGIDHIKSWGKNDEMDKTIMRGGNTMTNMKQKQ